MSMNQEKFGKIIKKIRKEHHLTQKDLADKYNVTYQAVSKWENGFYRPDPAIYPVIAEILGVTVDELLTGRGSINVEWEMRSQLHSIEHMVTFLKIICRQSYFTQTLKILPMMNQLYGDSKADIKGGDVPFIIHPLTVACHAVALGFKEDRILSVALLHDVIMNP